MTLPFQLYSYDKVAPVRNPELKLLHGGAYWRAVYPFEQQIMNDPAVSCKGEPGQANVGKCEFVNARKSSIDHQSAASATFVEDNPNRTTVGD